MGFVSKRKFYKTVVRVTIIHTSPFEPHHLVDAEDLEAAMNEQRFDDETVGFIQTRETKRISSRLAASILTREGDDGAEILEEIFHVNSEGEDLDCEECASSEDPGWCYNNNDPDSGQKSPCKSCNPEGEE